MNRFRKCRVVWSEQKVSSAASLWCSELDRFIVYTCVCVCVYAMRCKVHVTHYLMTDACLYSESLKRMFRLDRNELQESSSAAVETGVIQL